MTDLQDLICDRLIGATISREWANGPLHVAAQVLVPGFQLAGLSHNRRQNQLVGTLKWPRLFSLAFHRANAALGGEEDRRTLALTLFRPFAPPARPMRIRARQNGEAAAPARESARTEAKVRGVRGAVEVCEEAARLLGL